MKNKRMVVLLIFLFFISHPFVKAEEKEVIFGFSGNPSITQTSFTGKGMAEAREIFQTLADEVKKLYGYTVTLKIYPAPKFLFKAIQDKTADLASMELGSFLPAKSMGIPVHTLISYSTTGAKTDKYCLYVHKDSGIKNAKQLQGKGFAAEFPVFTSKKDELPPKESYIFWIMLKKMFAQNGIHKPFKEFFSEFRVLPVPYESVAYSVLLRRFDASLHASGDLQTLKNYDKAFRDVAPLSCINVPVMAPLVYRKDLNPSFVEKLKTYALHPPKGSQLEKIKKKYKGIGFFPVEDRDYAIYFQWIREAEKKGWIKEFDEIMAKVMKESKEKGKSKYIYEGKK